MTKFRRSGILCVILAIATIAALVLPVGSFTASAVENDFQYVSFGGSAYIQKYLGSDENVVIPSTLGGNTVTNLNDSVFKNCTSVKSVTIPDTVKRIGTYAFQGCVNLERVNIPSSVTYIGSKAFYGCESLKEIFIPSSVTYIGAEAFSYCYSLCAIEVDSNSKGYISVDGVLMDIGQTTIMQYPAGKTDESYTLPSKVWYIKQSAFAGCPYLKSITLQNNVTTLYEYAFADCTGLTSFTISSNINSIGSYVFDGCTSLEKFDVVKENSAFIAVDGVLFNKSQTRLVRYPCAKDDTEYTIPKTVTYVDYGGFADCTNLSSVTIHKGFYYFRDEAFRGCTGLTSITLPSSITSVGSRTFEGCNALESITISTQNIYYSSKDGVLFDKQKTKIHYYPQGKTDSSYTIPDTVTLIDTRAFCGADNLTKLVIPNSVETIREGAFLDCDSLTIYAKSESYAYKYATDNGINAVFTDIIKDISHRVENGKIIFTLVTYAGDYNRVKLTTPDNLSGSLAIASTYTVNEDGDYVWTVKTTKPITTTEYTFDFRSAETGRYLKDYTDYTAEIVTNIKSVSYERTNGKVIFTVVTSAGEFNRLKVTQADDLKGYIAYTNTYVVNGDGDYVWTITANAPEGEQEYAFDLRSTETGKYIREYSFSTVYPTIKSVSYRAYGNTLTFTVTTTAGNFDRLRCGINASTIGNLANANSYYENYYGEYVWTFDIEKPSETTTLYLDVRNSETGKFIKDYFIFDFVV